MCKKVPLQYTAFPRLRRAGLLGKSRIAPGPGERVGARFAVRKQSAFFYKRPQLRRDRPSFSLYRPLTVRWTAKTGLGSMRSVGDFRRLCASSNSWAKQQKPAKYQILKSCKNNRSYFCACKDLTNFEYEVHPTTGNGSYVNLQGTCLEKLVKSLQVN